MNFILILLPNTCKTVAGGETDALILKRQTENDIRGEAECHDQIIKHERLLPAVEEVGTCVIPLPLAAVLLDGPSNGPYDFGTL